MEVPLDQIIKEKLTQFSSCYHFADFYSSLCLKSEDSIPIDISSDMTLDWDDDFILARFGQIPLPVAIYRNCNEDNCAVALSLSCPACFRLSPSEDAVQIFVYDGIPPSIEDSVIIHELVEAELCLYYGVPQEAAHRIAIHLTYDYVRKNYDSDKLEVFSNLERTVGRSFIRLSKEDNT